MHLLSKASSERAGLIAKALQTALRQSSEQSFKRKRMMDLKREELLRAEGSLASLSQRLI